MHRIENEYLLISAREYGAELISVVDKTHGAELLWQADPAVWGWHAPVLFPVVGRCWNDRILINGQSYPMPKHGFARHATFQLIEQSESKLVFSLMANADSLAVYPYRFEFLIRYRLDGRQLICSYEVINAEEEPMYFSLGAHPAFNVPFAGGTYQDYFLEFEKEEALERHYINAEGFFDGRTEMLALQANTLALSQQMFTNDAVIFKSLKSRRIVLKNRLNERFIAVQYEGFDYLGLWAKPEAPYLCIEPWNGCADTAGKESFLSGKEGIATLEGKQRYTRTIVLQVG